MGRCETIAGGTYRLARWAAILLAASLAGCSGLRQWWDNGFKVGPDYTAAPAQVAEGWRDAGDPRLNARTEGDGCWWTVFCDPALNRLIEAACRQNLSLRGGRLSDSRVACGARHRGQQPLRAKAGNDLAVLAQPLQHQRLSLRRLPHPEGLRRLVDGLRRGLGIRHLGALPPGGGSGRRGPGRPGRDYDDILVLLQAEVAANYIQLRTIQQRIALTRENLDLQAKTLRLVELRYGKGLIERAWTWIGPGPRRPSRSRSCRRFEIGPAASGESAVHADGHAARRSAPLLASGGSIPAAPPEVIVGIPADLLRRRPDVRRAEREAAAQSARIGIAQAEFYPHIALTGTITLEAQNLSQVFRGSSLAGTVGPGFRWNILNYGRIANDVRAQDARFRQAVAQYQESVLKAHEETENAHRRLPARAGARSESLETAATATDQAVKLAMLQYEKGLVDYQPVLDTQRDLVRQQDAVAESRGHSWPWTWSPCTRRWPAAGRCDWPATRAGCPSSLKRPAASRPGRFLRSPRSNRCRPPRPRVDSGPVARAAASAPAK